MTEITAPRQHEKYDRLIAMAKKQTPLATAVAYPCDETSLRGGPSRLLRKDLLSQSLLVQRKRSKTSPSRFR